MSEEKADYNARSGVDPALSAVRDYPVSIGYTISKWSKSPDGLEGRIKSPIIWGHAKEKNCIVPVAYLRKPKWMDEESWKKVVSCIELKMPETFLSYDSYQPAIRHLSQNTEER